MTPTPISKSISIDCVYSAFDRTFEPDFKFKGERHNFWELVYVIDGVVGVAEDEKIYELTKGNIVFHKPMEFHRIWSEKGTSPRVLIMSFSETLGEIDVLGDGVFNIPPDIAEKLFIAHQYAQTCFEYEDRLVNQMLGNTIESFLISFIQTRFPVSNTKKTVGTQNYRRIIRVMEENVQKRMDSEQIAKECGMSLANLKKTFKQYSGIGVMDYFNRLKMTKAAEMLQNDYSVSEVSDMLGFSSSSYFLVAFKKHFSVSPSKYKKVYQNQRFIH